MWRIGPLGLKLSKATFLALWAILLLGAAGSCAPQAPRQVVVYCALDEEFARPVFERFEQQTGIRVLAKYDTEATKTVGLAQAILAERQRTRCDVFWNNEVLHTLRLHRAGLLRPLELPEARSFPEQFRAADGTWFGLAARARVLLVNTRLVPRDQWPRSVLDLANPRYRGKCAMAKPLFGTTATHAACLFAHWGHNRAKEFFQKIKDNQVHILAGNRHVAEAIAAGQVWFGITDTDDAHLALRAGGPVEIVFPDQGPGELGTLLIPNTVAALAQCPHPKEAQELVRFILSGQVEQMLALGPSAQIPLSSQVQTRPGIQVPENLKVMQVDFAQAARVWDQVVPVLRELFAQP